MNVCYHTQQQHCYLSLQASISLVAVPFFVCSMSHHMYTCIHTSTHALESEAYLPDKHFSLPPPSLLFYLQTGENGQFAHGIRVAHDGVRPRAHATHLAVRKQGQLLQQKGPAARRRRRKGGRRDAVGGGGSAIYIHAWWTRLFRRMVCLIPLNSGDFRSRERREGLDYDPDS